MDPGTSPLPLSEDDLVRLARCVELAAAAVADGDRPFGSILVTGDGRTLAEDRNREVTTGDPTAHPELALARWAHANLTAAERAAATVYTSGEHCPMCSAAHGLLGLGRIVYATSAEQTSRWLDELGAPTAAVRMAPIKDILPRHAAVGPVDAFAAEIRELHRLAWT
ncbi:MAG: nucleoside deaminase [Mycobacteriaceae bacterium]|nr:nucleoside deaminase [Mycobacteriaceae bacterium]